MSNTKSKISIVLYGLGGADVQYCALSYYAIYDDDVTVLTIRHHAELMKAFNPTIKEVYMIDNRPGLKHDYLFSVRKHTIESGIEFRDMIQRNGLKIL